jgi:hypothetical protein
MHRCVCVGFKHVSEKNSIQFKQCLSAVLVEWGLLEGIRLCREGFEVVSCYFCYSLTFCPGRLINSTPSVKKYKSVQITKVVF